VTVTVTVTVARRSIHVGKAQAAAHASLIIVLLPQPSRDKHTSVWHDLGEATLRGFQTVEHTSTCCQTTA
jgi:hypothetical protein